MGPAKEVKPIIDGNGKRPAEEVKPIAGNGMTPAKVRSVARNGKTPYKVKSVAGNGNKNAKVGRNGPGMDEKKIRTKIRA